MLTSNERSAIIHDWMHNKKGQGYTLFSDPGHGWLAVPRSELESLGILRQISSYSYQHGDCVFLEEDCDLSTFISARIAHNRPFHVIEKISSHYESPIRNNLSFSPEPQGGGA